MKDVEYPDYLMACVGGGSNAAGTIFHYIDDERVQIVLAEAGGKGIENRECRQLLSNWERWESSTEQKHWSSKTRTDR